MRFYRHMQSGTPKVLAQSVSLDTVFRVLFTRKLASQLLEASKARSAASGAAEANGGAPEPAAAPADASGVDLTGEREFLVAESAQEALASMLVERSTVSRVNSSSEPHTQALLPERKGFSGLLPRSCRLLTRGV